MKDGGNKNLLVMMVKEPVAGQVKTRLTPPLSPDDAAELYRCFLLDRISVLAALPGIDPALGYAPAAARDYFASQVAGKIDLFPQQGRDLGEKMQRMFGLGFEAGYEHVAIMGSDSPDLPGAMLEEAFSRLADPETGAVFGPCFDGGYYLVGLKGNCPELFDSMPWSRNDLLDRSLERAAALGLSVSLLPWWNDIDTFQDLQAFYGKLRRNGSAGAAARHTSARLAALAGQLSGTTLWRIDYEV